MISEFVSYLCHMAFSRTCSTQICHHLSPMKTRKKRLSLDRLFPVPPKASVTGSFIGCLLERRHRPTKFNVVKSQSEFKLI